MVRYMITFTFLEDYKHINQDGFPPSFLSSLSCNGRDGDSSTGVGQLSSFSSCSCGNIVAVVLSLSKQTKNQSIEYPSLQFIQTLSSYDQTFKEVV